MPYKDPAEKAANRRRYRLQGTPEQKARTAARNHEWKVQNLDKVRANDRSYRLRHAAQVAAGIREWGERHPEKVAEYGRTRRLRQKYGISRAEYHAMFAAQGGLCAICQQPETSLGRSKNGQPQELAVDHAHEPGLPVRGLLCQTCNLGLGQFRDDPEALERAAAYVRTHAAKASQPDLTVLYLPFEEVS